MASREPSYIIPHMQDPFRDWNLQMARAHAAGSPYRGLKSFHPEDYVQLMNVSPTSFFAFRQWVDDVSQGTFIDRAGDGQGDEAADSWIRYSADSINHHMGTVDTGKKYFISVNEEYPTHVPDKIKATVEFDRAFVRRLPVHCPGVRPIVFTAAIGNPDHDEYHYLVDLAAETAQAGGAFGYHAYWTVRDGRSWVRDWDVAKDLHMRWAVIDDYLVNRYGIRVDWILGEVGATRGNSDGYSPDVYAGWKNDRVWDGDINAYIEDIRGFDEMISQTRAAREGRILGAALFTSRPGDGGEWKDFNVVGGDFQRLTDYVASRPVTVEDGGTEPPPPPDDEDISHSAKVQIWRDSVSAQIKSGISLNPHAKLQGAILDDGYMPVHSERRYADEEGKVWAWQPAETLDANRPRRVYVCRAFSSTEYGPVMWYYNPQ